jgi:hypothetical protein
LEAAFGRKVGLGGRSSATISVEEIGRINLIKWRRECSLMEGEPGREGRSGRTFRKGRRGEYIICSALRHVGWGGGSAGLEIHELETCE